LHYRRDFKEVRFCGFTVFPTKVFEAGIYSSIIFCGSMVLTNAVYKAKFAHIFIENNVYFVHLKAGCSLAASAVTGK
jgi:hypothetical protein